MFSNQNIRKHQLSLKFVILVPIFVNFDVISNVCYGFNDFNFKKRAKGKGLSLQGLVEVTQISSWSLGVGLREIIDRDLELWSETWTWRDLEIENHLSVSSDKDLALWSETCT